MACHGHHHHGHGHHCHGQHGHGHHHHDAAGNISAAFWLNALFVVVEIVGGLWTNSIAILSDALHDFGDCLSLLTAWLLQKKSKQPRSATYSYGYKRFSLLGAVFLGGVLTVSSVWVIVEAVERLLAPQAVNAEGMVWIAVVGIAINGAAALRVKHGTSLNERMVYLHILEDALGWVAVLVASIVMHFVDVPILDPLLSIAISVWVLWNVVRGMRATFTILLQAVPDGMCVQALSAELMAIDGIEDIHDLRLWSLDGESHVMTLHAVVRGVSPCEAKAAIKRVAEAHHIEHTTIEIDLPDTPCACADVR